MYLRLNISHLIQATNLIFSLSSVSEKNRTWACFSLATSLAKESIYEVIFALRKRTCEPGQSHNLSSSKTQKAFPSAGISISLGVMITHANKFEWISKWVKPNLWVVPRRNLSLPLPQKLQHNPPRYFPWWRSIMNCGKLVISDKSQDK